MNQNHNKKSTKQFDDILYENYRPENKLITENKNTMPIRQHKNKRRFVLFIFLSFISFCLIILTWGFINFTSASNILFPGSPPWQVLKTSPLKKDTSGRTNILLIGNSTDDPGHGGADLTDTILIISLDKSSKSGFLLNIPRDLYVEIPGYGTAKINEAYQAGEALSFQDKNTPYGGAGLLQKIISDNFDIDINYLVVMNFGAVRDIVNAVGGIEINIKNDDPRGIFDPNFPTEQGGPLILSNGKHHIDGNAALKLTRARGATYESYGFAKSDFDRTKNQQQVFLATKNKITWWLVFDPRLNGQLFQAIAQNVTTDIKINELLPLYHLLTMIPNSKLESFSLNDIDGKNLLTGYQMPIGQDALIPAAGMYDYSDIKSVINNIMLFK